MYYDPKYDSQSNFPAAKIRVERLHIREGGLTNEQMDCWGVVSVAQNLHLSSPFMFEIFSFFYYGKNIDDLVCICNISREIRNYVFPAQLPSITVSSYSSTSSHLPLIM